MLETVNVTKAFDGKKVLSGFSMRFEPGEHYCLMGPSGCGKTTLLNVLMGLEKPDEGEVRGQRGCRFSAVFQEDRLLEPLSALENVRFVSNASVADAQELLLALGIPKESLSSPVATFSGGMKRRVALCRALLADYDMLILDEPYKGLDDLTRETVIRMVAERTVRQTVLLVTHDARDVQGYRLVTLGSR